MRVVYWSTILPFGGEFCWEVKDFFSLRGRVRIAHGLCVILSLEYRWIPGLRWWRGLGIRVCFSLSVLRYLFVAATLDNVYLFWGNLTREIQV